MSMTDFEEAAKTPHDLNKFPVYVPVENPRNLVAQTDETMPRGRNCPTCPDGGYVVPYDGDGKGNVTEYRCIKCRTNFKPEESAA